MKTIESVLSCRGLRRTLIACAAAGATLLVAAPASAAGSAYVVADVQCDGAGDGVVDITLINDSGADAAFEVNGGSYTVASGSAYAMTVTGIADGPYVVPASVDGADASVSVNVACDAPRVEALAPAVRNDTLPATGDEVVWGLVVGGVLVVAGVLVSLLARRRYS